MILYIEDRNIRVDNADNQISYNSDYIAEFHFDDEWNGKVKTARFVQNGEYVDVVLVDDRCEIPPLKTGFVRVGVFTDSMTSTYADVYYKTSIKDGSGNPVEPPEDVYAQLTALIESGMLKGEDGLTPYVGENNNWWIGDIDTGILARGTDGYTPVKGVDYFTEGEVQQIQNEVSESIQANINHLEINKADKSELDKTNLSLDALWKMNKGQTYDVLEQESEAYSVDVPSGAKYVGIDEVGGKSVVWNQLWNYEKAGKEAGITYTYENHFYDVIKNTTANNGLYVYHNCKSNNKYYMSYEASSNDSIKLVLSLGVILIAELTESNKRYRDIITTNTSRNVIYLYSPSGVTCSYRVGNIKVIDLTQMFGAGNEPNTVEEFEAMFPADYYPYSEPTIISSQTDRIDVRGKNLFDNRDVTVYSAYLKDNGVDKIPQWFYSDDSKSIRIPCEPNTTYTISLPVASTVFRVGSTPSDLAPLTWGSNVALTQRIDAPNSKSVTCTTGESDKYLIVQIGFSTMDMFISDGQIEKGSVATEYSPYSLQQITTGFPVLHFNDYIDLNGKKLHRRTEIYTFSGSEKFVNVDSGKFYLDKSEDLSLRIANLTVDNSKNMYILSDKIPNYSWFDLISKDLGIAIRSDGGRNYIRIVNTNLTSLEELAEFCKGMSVAIISEEIITDITIPTELTDWLTVEAGGSVTFHNADEGKRLLIPNKLSFVRKLDEVTV